MENWYRSISGAGSALAAFFAPAAPLIGCALLFIAVDFVAGVCADRAVTRQAGRPWYFESRKAWRTAVKLALALTAIVMAWLLQRFVLDFVDLHIDRICTGFICGVEFWSFLENAAQLSDAPAFRWIRRYVRKRIIEQTGLDPHADDGVS